MHRIIINMWCSGSSTISGISHNNLAWTFVWHSAKTDICVALEIVSSYSVSFSSWKSCGLQSKRTDPLGMFGLDSTYVPSQRFSVSMLLTVSNKQPRKFSESPHLDTGELHPFAPKVASSSLWYSKSKTYLSGILMGMSWAISAHLKAMRLSTWTSRMHCITSLHMKSVPGRYAISEVLLYTNAGKPEVIKSVMPWGCYYEVCHARCTSSIEDVESHHCGNASQKYGFF